MRTPVEISWGCLLVLMSGCFGSSHRIPMIGLDSQGQSVQLWVSEAEYTEKINRTVTNVQDSITPTLARIESTSTRAQSSPWMLRTLLVGTGVNMEIGVDPIVKVGVFPRFRMVFSNSTEPPMP